MALWGLISYFVNEHLRDPALRLHAMNWLPNGLRGLGGQRYIHASDLPLPRNVEASRVPTVCGKTGQRGLPWWRSG